VTSSKLSARRQTRGTPPICKPPPPPPPPPSYPAPTSEAHLAYIQAQRLPDPPRPPFAEITTRNLIFHCYACQANDAATRALAQLRIRWHLFNGRKLIAVATDKTTIPLPHLKRLLPADAEYLIIPNDRRLREMASFPTMLREVRSLDEQTATFYAHTKGASPTQSNDGTANLAITYWTLRMFHHLLDDWDQVQLALKLHACAGCYQIDYSHIPGFIMESPTGARCGQWHYAGTFFWFRHDQIFRRPAWSCLPDDSYAPEMWLGTLLRPELATTLYQPWDPHDHAKIQPYNPATHQPPVPGPPPPLDNPAGRQLQ
jgi:hypothetical protein